MISCILVIPGIYTPVPGIYCCTNLVGDDVRLSHSILLVTAAAVQHSDSTAVAVALKQDNQSQTDTRSRPPSPFVRAYNSTQPGVLLKQFAHHFQQQQCIYTSTAVAGALASSTANIIIMSHNTTPHLVIVERLDGEATCALRLALLHLICLPSFCSPPPAGTKNNQPHTKKARLSALCSSAFISHDIYARASKRTTQPTTGRNTAVEGQTRRRWS